MVPWGRPRLGRWWDGSERNSTGGFGYPKSRGTCSVLMLTRRSHGSTLLPLALAHRILAATAPCPPSPPSPRPAGACRDVDVACDGVATAHEAAHQRHAAKPCCPTAGRCTPSRRSAAGSWRLDLQRPNSSRATAGTRSATSTAICARGQYGVSVRLRGHGAVQQDTPQQALRQMRRRRSAPLAEHHGNARRIAADGRHRSWPSPRVAGGSWSTDVRRQLHESGTSWYRIGYVTGKASRRATA